MRELFVAMAELQSARSKPPQMTWISIWRWVEWCEEVIMGQVCQLILWIFALFLRGDGRWLKVYCNWCYWFWDNLYLLYFVKLDSWKNVMEQVFIYLYIKYKCYYPPFYAGFEFWPGFYVHHVLKRI